MHFVPFLIHTNPHSHSTHAHSLATSWDRGVALENYAIQNLWNMKRCDRRVGRKIPQKLNAPSILVKVSRLFSLKALKPKYTGSTRPLSACWANHMALCVITYKVPQTTISTTSLISWTQERDQAPKVVYKRSRWLSYSARWLRPAPPIDFIPPTLRGSRCALFSICFIVFINTSLLWIRLFNWSIPYLIDQLDVFRILLFN